MEKRQTVLVMAERSAEITAQLAARFGSRCELLFAENEPDFGAALSRADAIIGEPEEVQLQNARALSWLQLTWAGADKYARMARFPAGVTLCNVSGAFGTVISEYVLGSIVALYRALPVYWSQQKAHVWQQHAKGSTICGKRALVFGMGDLGANVARRLSAFGAQVTSGAQDVKHCPRGLRMLTPWTKRMNFCRRQTSSSTACRPRRKPRAF